MFPDDADTLFWLDTVQGINPAPHEKVSYVANPEKIVIHERNHFATKQEFTTYSKAFEDAEYGGIDKATLKKFKQEEFKIEAVLDLHGYREDDAYERVADFIAKCYGEGKRCVIIVTGKGGLHQQEDFDAPRGVLKKQVPQWLNTPQIRAMILVFKNPSERLGGEGVLYILLKRNREL